MIIDTSAIIAILAEEVDAHRYARALALTSSSISTGTYLECSIVLTRKTSIADHLFDAWLHRAGIEIVDMTAEQVRVGRMAFREFGKGSGHRAALNFGDCFSYALAAHVGEPLLWKGDDFTHTGIPSALEHLGL